MIYARGGSISSLHYTLHCIEQLKSIMIVLNIDYFLETVNRGVLNKFRHNKSYCNEKGYTRRAFSLDELLFYWFVDKLRVVTILFHYKWCCSLYNV